MTTTTLREAFLAKYDLPKIPQFFEEATGKPFAWESLNKARLAKFVEHMKSHIATSSVKVYCAYLKSVLNLYSDQVELPKGWERTLSVKADPSEHVYLDEAELHRIINYRPDTMTEAIVQQQFIISALVGARHSDAQTLTADNIVGDKICYISQKTRIKAIVPLSPVVKTLLTDGVLPAYQDAATSLFATAATDFAFAFKRSVSDPCFNDTLRRIAYLCDIDQPVKIYRQGGYVTLPKHKLIASHCGRRSFATCLYLRCHDLYLVSRLCGHSSIDMTMRYICSPIDDVSDEVLAFFQQYS